MRKKKCYIYTRVSTMAQTEGYSLDAQQEKLRKYAEYENLEIPCIDILSELVEKYGDKVLESISNSANSGSECDYIFISSEMSVLCEVEKVTNEDITKAYVNLAQRGNLIEKSA